MKLHAICLSLLAVFFGSLTLTEASRQPKDAVLLKNIKSLTLRNGQKTSHRRVSALPQLKCIGGGGRGHYEVDTMRCTNSGSGYDEHDVEWTCVAALPPEFKLGSTDVICEGYSSPDDPYVLKGSCGVEYRLILTGLGEEKYGSKSWFNPDSWSSTSEPRASKPREPASERFFNFAFFALFIGVGLWIAYVFVKSLINPNGQRRQPRVPRVPRGGGGYDDGNDPPPPYDSGDWPRNTKGQGQGSGNTGSWRPGFWTGAATGAAATYFSNTRTRNRVQEQQDSWLRGTNRGSSWMGGGGDSGEGSSGTRRSSSQASSEPSSSRYESTGFGSSRRR